MKLQNNFSDDTRSLFIFKYDCDWCGHNQWTDFHHILGRCSASILNVATLHNDRCHIGNGKLSQFEVRKKLLKKTLEYLLETEYVLTKEDKIFKKKYAKYY